MFETRERRLQPARIRSFQKTLSETTSEANRVELIAKLNSEKEIYGILLQLPLPAHPQGILDAIGPAKDVDGFHAQNVGRLWSGGKALVPCTPYGCLLLLDDIRPQMAGANVVVLGRSNIVGKPMAALLLGRNSSVTLVHSKSRNLPALLPQADILVAAVGQPELVRGDWIKLGAIVVDVDTNRLTSPNGTSKLIGDAAFYEAQGVAAAITPVPGGVGPTTIACLLRNRVIAAYPPPLSPRAKDLICDKVPSSLGS